MDALDAGPSHTVALALAIIMQERSCEAGVASGWLHARAAEQGLQLHDMAEAVVTDGADRTEPLDARAAAGTRVALVVAVALWPPGSSGTVVGPSGPGLGQFDVLVDLDAGGQFFFRHTELRTLDLATSGASQSSG